MAKHEHKSPDYYLSESVLLYSVIIINTKQKEKVFSCEEAALEVQMLSLCVCVCVWVSVKLNITKVRLFEVYTKPIDCTRIHKTSLLYKCIQN